MTKSRDIRHRVPIAPLFLAIGLGGELFVLKFIPSSDVIIGTWLSSLIGLGAIWGFVRFRYRTILPLQSNILVAIGFTILFFLPPLYCSLFFEQAPMLDVWGVADTYPLVIFATLLGVSALLLGYEAVGKLTRDANLAGYPSGRSSSRRMTTLVIVVGVIGWAARGIALSQGIYYTAYQNIEFMVGRWNSIIGQVADYGLLLPVLLWLLSDRERRWRLWAWIFTAAEFLWRIPSGSAGPIFIVLFTFLLVFWWRIKRVPKLPMATLFLVGLVTIPVIREYRYTIGEFTGRRQVSAAATVSGVVGAMERMEGSLEDRGIMAFADHLFSRLFEGQSFAYLLKHYRGTYEWEAGETYLSRLPFVIIPYFLFTDRPIMAVSINEWFDLVVGSAPVTMLGEAYINFGYVGIPIIGFLVGMILALYDLFTIRRYSNDPIIVSVYIMLGGYMVFALPVQGVANVLSYLRNIVLIMISLQIVYRFSLSYSGSACKSKNLS